MSLEDTQKGLIESIQAMPKSNYITPKDRLARLTNDPKTEISKEVGITNQDDENIDYEALKQQLLSQLVTANLTNTDPNTIEPVVEPDKNMPLGFNFATGESDIAIYKQSDYANQTVNDALKTVPASIQEFSYNYGAGINSLIESMSRMFKQSVDKTIEMKRENMDEDNTFGEMFSSLGFGSLFEITADKSKENAQIWRDWWKESKKKWNISEEFEQSLFGQIEKGLVQMPGYIALAGSGIAGGAGLLGVSVEQAMSKYDEIVPENERDDDKRALFGLTAGIPMAILEKVGLDFITKSGVLPKRLTVGAFTTWVAKEMIKGGVVEEAEEVSSSMILSMAANGMLGADEEILTVDSLMNRIRENGAAFFIGALTKGVANSAHVYKSFANNDFSIISKEQWKTFRLALSDDVVRNSDMLPDMKEVFIRALNGDVKAQDEYNKIFYEKMDPKKENETINNISNILTNAQEELIVEAEQEAALKESEKAEIEATAQTYAELFTPEKLQEIVATESDISNVEAEIFKTVDPKELARAERAFLAENGLTENTGTDYEQTYADYIERENSLKSEIAQLKQSEKIAQLKQSEKTEVLKSELQQKESKTAFESIKAPAVEIPFGVFKKQFTKPSGKPTRDFIKMYGQNSLEFAYLDSIKTLLSDNDLEASIQSSKLLGEDYATWFKNNKDLIDASFKPNVSIDETTNLKDNIADAKNRLADIQKQKAIFQKALDPLQKNVLKISDKKQFLESEMTDTEKELNEIISDEKKLNKKINSTQKTISKLESEISQEEAYIQSRIDDANNIIDSYYVMEDVSKQEAQEKEILNKIQQLLEQEYMLEEGSFDIKEVLDYVAVEKLIKPIKVTSRMFKNEEHSSNDKIYEEYYNLYKSLPLWQKKKYFKSDTKPNSYDAYIDTYLEDFNPSIGRLSEYDLRSNTLRGQKYAEFNDADSFIARIDKFFKQEQYNKRSKDSIRAEIEELESQLKTPESKKLSLELDKSTSKLSVKKEELAKLKDELNMLQKAKKKGFKSVQDIRDNLIRNAVEYKLTKQNNKVVEAYKGKLDEAKQKLIKAKSDVKEIGKELQRAINIMPLEIRGKIKELGNLNQVIDKSQVQQKKWMLEKIEKIESEIMKSEKKKMRNAIIDKIDVIKKDIIEAKQGKKKSKYANAQALEDYISKIKTEKELIDDSDKVVNMLQEMQDVDIDAVKSIFEGQLNIFDDAVSYDDLVRVYESIDEIAAEGAFRKKIKEEAKKEALLNKAKNIASEMKGEGVDLKKVNTVRPGQAKVRATRFAWDIINPESFSTIFTGKKDSLFYDEIIQPIYDATNKVTRGLHNKMGLIQQIHKGIDINKAKNNKFVQVNGEWLTLDNAMSVYAYSQNEHSRQILYNTKLGDSFIDDAIINEIVLNLDDQYKDMVDEMINFYDTVDYSRTNNVFKKIFGVDMIKRGRYFPIVGLQRGNGINNFLAEYYNDISIGRGHTKAVKAHSLGFNNLSYFNTIHQHAINSERFINMTEAVNNVNFMLGTDDIRSKLRGVSLEGEKQMKDWLADSAYGKIREDDGGVHQVVEWLDKQRTIALLGGNIGTMFKQFAGMYPSIMDTDKGLVARASFEFMKDPNKMIDFARLHSEVMLSREYSLEQDFFRQSNEASIKELFGGNNAMLQGFKEFSMAGIKKIDVVTTTIAWTAKYQEVLLETGDETKAIKEADRVIIRTQPTNNVAQMARLYRKQGISRMIMKFTQQLNKYLNLNIENIIENKSSAKKAMDFISINIIPATMLYMATELNKEVLRALGLRDDDEDDYEKNTLAEIGKEGMAQFIGGIPFVKTIVMSGLNNIDGGAKFYETRVDISALQTVADIASATSGDEDKVVKAVGMVLGVPATTIVSQQLKD